MRSTRLSEIAKRYGLTMRGPDREIVKMGSLSSRSQHRDRLLTFVRSARWLANFERSGLAACIAPLECERQLRPGMSALLARGDATEAFYQVFLDTVNEERWERLPTSFGVNVDVAPSAVVHEGVVIGDECSIMDNAVVLPNTRLGRGVNVQPNATIGSDGFQVRTIQGRRRVIPHAGGVDLGDDSFIGAQTCVDRGLFGEFTSVASGAMIDNLVHVAHAAEIGRNATVIACSEISGSATVGDGAWLGPNSSVNPGVVIGHHAYIGTASTVVRDIPAFALAYGSPARAAAWVCHCHAKLPGETGVVDCTDCGATFSFATGQPEPVRD